MGLEEIKAALLKKGASPVSLAKKTEPKEPKKASKTPKRYEIEPEPKNVEEVEEIQKELKKEEVDTQPKEDNGKAYEEGCDVCGESPEDCDCDDCDCDK